MNSSNLILASGSPRRKQLLETLGIAFTAVSPNTDEAYDKDLAPEEIVKHVSLKKAEAVAKNNPSTTIIAADTVVVLGSEILEKPKDEKDAKEMLRKLSGRWHSVYTGISIIHGDKITQLCEITRVHFIDIDDEMIKWYVQTNEPMDKAGAYGIQGYGSVIVDKIEGDFYNVMGFPVSRIMTILKKLKIYDIGRG